MNCHQRETRCQSRCVGRTTVNRKEQGKGNGSASRLNRSHDLMAARFVVCSSSDPLSIVCASILPSRAPLSVLLVLKEFSLVLRVSLAEDSESAAHIATERAFVRRSICTVPLALSVHFSGLEVSRVAAAVPPPLASGSAHLAVCEFSFVDRVRRQRSLFRSASHDAAAVLDAEHKVARVLVATAAPRVAAVAVSDGQRQQSRAGQPSPVDQRQSARTTLRCAASVTCLLTSRAPLLRVHSSFSSCRPHSGRATASGRLAAAGSRVRAGVWASRRRRRKINRHSHQSAKDEANDKWG